MGVSCAPRGSPADVLSLPSVGAGWEMRVRGGAAAIGEPAAGLTPVEAAWIAAARGGLRPSKVGYGGVRRAKAG